MIVVADASPLRYLVGIGVVDALNSLYGRVLVPVAVAGELQDAKTPATVRAWIAHPPAWCEIRPDPPFDPALRRLDAGERSAIALALLLPADVLLMDEWGGRAEARRRRLLVTETLGALADAHLAGLLDFETALAQLRITNFYISEDVIAGIRQRLSRAAISDGCPPSPVCCFFPERVIAASQWDLLSVPLLVVLQLRQILHLRDLGKQFTVVPEVSPKRLQFRPEFPWPSKIGKGLVGRSI